MKTKLKMAGFTAFAVLLMLPGSLSYSQYSSPQLRPELDFRGAVLCHWLITVNAHAIGEHCDSENNKPALDRLDNVIDRINAFIIRNSDTTQEQIDRGRKSEKAKLQDRVNESDSMKVKICAADGDSMKLWVGYRDIDPGELKKQIDKLLEVDRKPVLNPCF